jgi:amidohydrolase
MKSKVQECIKKRRNEIINLGDRIFNNPETGFKEFNTSRLVAEKFRELGFECTEFSDIPGVKATLDTGKDGPCVAILGELDSIICTEHPLCNRETGAVHACGHNAQIASLFGAAVGLLESGIAGELTGKIHFMAVPAEEYIEVAYRKELREKGVIRYLGGKPELMSRGWFDDVDMAMMIHTTSGGDKKILIEKSSNGCIVKKIKYIGKASHAGGSPHEGINALYAANIGLAAINAIRETFRESDYIRVHPIITKGGDIVNVIPDDVRMETFVRGISMEGILKANKKVNNALVGGAVAIGAKVEIEDIPGYFPFFPDDNFRELGKKVAKELADESEICELAHSAGSTDMGDLSTVIPVIQPYIGGSVGGLHTADFRITDPDTAYLMGAKFLACTAAELLSGDAAAAKDIIRSFSPMFKSKQEYFDYADKLFSVRLLPEHDIMD